MDSPGPVEILRAAQKDDIFVDRFEQEIQSAFEDLLGQGSTLKWRKWFKYVAVGVYLSCTNLAGFQTLGEEYAGLLQTDSTFRRVPTKRMTAAMIVLQCLGPVMMERGLKEVGQALSRKGRGADLQQESGKECKTVSRNVSLAGELLAQSAQHCLPFLRRLHLVIFYLQGRFYHLSKRLTGIHYFLVRKWFANQDANSKRNLKYLRIMSAINLTLTVCHDVTRLLTSQRRTDRIPSSKLEEGQASLDPSRKCSLCLEVRKNPSLTPCGHLFCWDCVMDWLQTKEECPICRTDVTSSRIVPLQNHF